MPLIVQLPGLGLTAAAGYSDRERLDHLDRWTFERLQPHSAPSAEF
jgi:hypothetical protein